MDGNKHKIMFEFSRLWNSVRTEIPWQIYNSVLKPSNIWSFIWLLGADVNLILSQIY